MRLSAILMAAMLVLAPLAAAQAGGPVVVEVNYLGHGEYLFSMKIYDYTGVVKAIQASHPSGHVDLVSVDMPQGSSLLDRKEVCRLRRDLGTQLQMHLDVGDGTSAPQFCN